MTNPFQKIKQEAHLTQAEKSAMRSSLVFEMNKKVETTVGQFSTSKQKIKSPFVFSSKYFFSGVAVLAAVVFVVTNLQKQTTLVPSVMMENQVASDSLMTDNSIALQDNIVSGKPDSKKELVVPENQSSAKKLVATTASGNSNSSYSVTSNTASSPSYSGSLAAVVAPKLIIKFKSGNEFLINYIPVCYNNGELTCYPGYSDLKNKPTYLGNAYYYMTAAGDAFSLVTYQEAKSGTDDSQLLSLFSKGIKMSFRDATVAGYECNQVAHSVEELKAIVASGSVEKCQKLW
jgi:hypothetical protein